MLEIKRIEKIRTEEIRTGVADGRTCREKDRGRPSNADMEDENDCTRVFPRSAPRVISAQNLILTHSHPDFRAFGRTGGA